MPLDFKVASRIRKLLALAGSPEPNEAASARASARRLMRKHGVTEAEVSASGAEFAEVYLGWRGFDSAWKFDLASVAARTCSCEALGLRDGRRRRVRVVGRRRDAEEAAELFKYLLRELDLLARTEMVEVLADLMDEFPSSYRRLAACYLGEFREGAVAGFARSLRSSAAASTPPTPPPEQGELARVEGGGVREHLVARGAREAPRGGGPADPVGSYLVGDEAYASGWRQARRVPIPWSDKGGPSG